MYTRKNYFKTGVFIFVGILIFGATFKILSTDDGLFTNKKKLHSYFNETQGLMFGSVVSFSGITIGNVQNINYSSEKQALKVTFTIKDNFKDLIKEDSYAQLKTQGALGDRYVYISQGSPESPSVAGEGEILSKKSMDIFNVVENKLNGIPDLDRLSKKIELLIDTLNSEEGITGNLKELKLTLKESKETFKSLNKDKTYEKSLKKLDSVLNKIDKGQGSLGKLINDPSLFNKIQNFLGQKENTESYLKELGQKTIQD